MTIEDLIELERKLGHRILKTESCYWVTKENNRLAIALPIHNTTFPTQEDFKSLFRKGIKIVTFKTQMSVKNTYEYVFNGTDYNIANFGSKVRNRIKKGLKDCTIKNARLEDLLVDGLAINHSTLAKHNERNRCFEDVNLWSNHISVFSNYKDACIVGAYIQGKLVSYMGFNKVGDVYNVTHVFMNYQHTASCPENAIIYFFINEILKREGRIKISYGFNSYRNTQGLDKFKTGMLFSPVPCTRVVIVNPNIKAFVNRIGYSVLNILNGLKVVDKTLVEKYGYILDNKKLANSYWQIGAEKALHSLKEEKTVLE